MNVVIDTTEVLLDALERRGSVRNLNASGGFVDGEVRFASFSEHEIEFGQKFLPEINLVIQCKIDRGAAAAAGCATRAPATTPTSASASTGAAAPATRPA